jgi:hypothetical protein
MGCTDGGVLTPHGGKWGDWGHNVHCAGGFSGVSVRIKGKRVCTVCKIILTQDILAQYIYPGERKRRHCNELCPTLLQSDQLLDAERMREKGRLVRGILQEQPEDLWRQCQVWS